MLPAPYKRFARLLTNNILHLRATHLTIFFAIISLQANSQLAKKTWLVGGSGNFLASKNSYSDPTYSSTSNRIDIKISPDIGFFVMDKFGIGLRPSFSRYSEHVNGPGGLTSKISRLEFGPFARFYLLQKNNQCNIIADVSYQYGVYYSRPVKGNINTLSASAGTVIFFNSSVGIEFLVGYYSRKEVIPLTNNGKNITSRKGIQINIGFQIHLEK